MPSDSAVSEPLRECLETQRGVLSEYIRVVDALIAVLVGHESTADLRSEDTPIPDPYVPVLTMMLQAAGSSSHTLVRLSDQPGLHTRDCYSIARSIVELAVNICFVMASGPEIAERAARHARQKAFRDMARESKIGESAIRLRLEGAPDASVLDGFEEDIEEFTSRAGREKGWIDASIDERIAAVEKLSKNAMTGLHWARFAVYRHSSEVLHGTFFSALHFFGLTDPSGGPRSPSQLEEQIGQQHMLVLMSATLALSGVVQSFHAAYGFRSAQERDEALMDALRAVPLFQEPSGS
jgi:hypothetical protein